MTQVKFVSVCLTSLTSLTTPPRGEDEESFACIVLLLLWPSVVRVARRRGAALLALSLRVGVPKSRRRGPLLSTVKIIPCHLRSPKAQGKRHHPHPSLHHPGGGTHRARTHTQRSRDRRIYHRLAGVVDTMWPLPSPIRPISPMRGNPTPLLSCLGCRWPSQRSSDEAQYWGDSLDK